jgi:hypothetical protein
MGEHFVLLEWHSKQTLQVLHNVSRCNPSPFSRFFFFFFLFFFKEKRIPDHHLEETKIADHLE